MAIIIYRSQAKENKTRLDESFDGYYQKPLNCLECALLQSWCSLLLYCNVIKMWQRNWFLFFSQQNIASSLIDMELENCNQARKYFRTFLILSNMEKSSHLIIIWRIENSNNKITKSVHLISFTIKNIISLSNPF